VRVIDVGIDLNISDQPPDHAATLTTLFREHHLGLVRMAVLIVGDQPTAEDVVQDAYWSPASPPCGVRRRDRRVLPRHRCRPPTCRP
jgi:hypothetical protein